MTFEFVFEKEVDIGAIHCSKDIKPLLMNYAQSPQEIFLAITLDSAYNPIKCHMVSLGTANKSMVHPRDVFREAITDNAVAVIVAHNHPSGNTEPSKQDIETTETLEKAGQLIGIQVLDHIIFAPNGDTYGFADHGLMGDEE